MGRDQKAYIKLQQTIHAKQLKDKTFLIFSPSINVLRVATDIEGKNMSFAHPADDESLAHSDWSRRSLLSHRPSACAYIVPLFHPVQKNLGRSIHHRRSRHGEPHT